MKTFLLSLAVLFITPSFVFALANPASVKCIQDGGDLVIKTDERSGKYAECTLPSGLVCEEWAYFHNVCGGKTFIDTQNDAFAEDIQYVKDAGIVSGYSDGSYRPKSTINRAEFTKIIMASLFSEQEINDCDVKKYTFSDTPANEWFSHYVCIAKKEGIINGYADGTFRAGNTITFPEAMKIIFKGFKKPVDNPACFIADDFVNGVSTSRCEEWFMPYLLAGSSLFSAKIPALANTAQLKSLFATYKISRGEMAYFIATLKNKPAEEGAGSSGNASGVFIPHTCISWFDGCNTCTVENGVLGGCTKMFCVQPEKPYCKEHKVLESPELMVEPSYDNVPKGCTSWFDGCNTCVLSGASVMACTMKACFSADGKPTEKPRCLSYIK